MKLNYWVYFECDKGVILVDDIRYEQMNAKSENLYRFSDLVYLAWRDVCAAEPLNYVINNNVENGASQSTAMRLYQLGNLDVRRAFPGHLYDSQLSSICPFREEYTTNLGMHSEQDGS